MISSSNKVLTIIALSAGLMVICGLGLSNVVVNEVELNPPESSARWVELYNTGDQAVDLTGWMVSIRDDPWVGNIPLNGTIEPKGFYVAEGQLNWAAESYNGTVFLIDNTENR